MSELYQVDQRVVRVFVSSTFRDMQAERDELALYVFPELRKRCRERYVEFDGVDLRWGITEEQSKRGKVLPICLAMIERCHPYFVGLLGERYGWTPDRMDDELIEKQKWLKGQKGKSVTELEIIHGVLKNPKMEKVSFFYFRDPETSQKVEEELAGGPDYRSEPETSRAGLEALKEKIREHEENYPVPVRLNYPDAKTLGLLVLEDLWAAIDKRFPESEVPSRLERDRMEHEAFAGARRKVYIAREDYYKRLDEHIKSEDSPLVILGESGSGKSALIVNWVDKYKKDHHDDFIITHFIGSTPDSADYTALLRRIMEEIKARYEPASKESTPSPLRGEGWGEGEIPIDPQKIVEVFPLWLAKAAAKGKLILVLDALNQIEHKDNAPDLGWLPTYFPPNVRVILSTLPGRSLDALNRRSLPTPISVGEMEPEEQKIYIEKYLKRSGRELDPAQIERIVKSKQAANPLYLRTLLEELKVFGVHEKLNEKIGHYLKAGSVEELFGLMLERLEGAYERDRNGLVRDSMTLIWAARRGLAETELLEMLGTDGKPLPRAYWSPLYLALEESLVSRSGLLNFFHDFLKKAVEDKYLHNDESKRVSRLCLVDYFKNSPYGRKVDEYPYQLQHADQWQYLAKALSDLDFFSYAWEHNCNVEWVGYWVWIKTRFSLFTFCKMSMGEDDWQLLEESCEPKLCYKNAIEARIGIEGKSQGIVKLLLRIGDLLGHMGLYIYALPLLEQALDISESIFGQDHPDVVPSLNNLATLYYIEGWYHLAEPLYKRALAIEENRHELQYHRIACIRGNLAGLYLMQSKFAEAEHYADRALEIEIKCLGDNDPEIAFELKTLAGIYYYQHEYAHAERLYKKALTLRETSLGLNHPGLTVFLNDLATNYMAQDKCKEALPLLEKAMSIAEVFLGFDHPTTKLYKINVEECRERLTPNGIAQSLIDRALSLNEMGRQVEALQLAEEAYSIASKRGLVELKQWIRPFLEAINGTNSLKDG
jgi:nephrocystin-3